MVVSILLNNFVWHRGLPPMKSIKVDEKYVAKFESAKVEMKLVCF